MVIQQKEPLASLKKEVIRRKYTVERRIYKDVFWYQGWFSSLVPEWSDWEPMYSYSKVNHAGSMYKTLMKGKPYNKNTLAPSRSIQELNY